MSQSYCTDGASFGVSKLKTGTDLNKFGTYFCILFQCNVQYCVRARIYDLLMYLYLNKKTRKSHVAAQFSDLPFVQNKV